MSGIFRLVFFLLILAIAAAITDFESRKRNNMPMCEMNHECQGWEGDQQRVEHELSDRYFLGILVCCKERECKMENGER